ncbi:hypothetical protein [Absicoccus intestinalis]|uniref:Uncharacterized protein n=1 Tax=Absicoccus intestinalis TaxID=2926319 RepID=A0ABU4WLH5_9FIRM|nr:hypothetical protein [Absicoccus sp. CLA-KB-P134]MDX8417392.1 hypothetical protein [Absicoccus sp. CLA-KB-P134]
MTTQDILFWMDFQDELEKFMPADTANEITRKLIEREDKKQGDIESLKWLNDDLDDELQEYKDMIDEIRRIV